MKFSHKHIAFSLLYFTILFSSSAQESSNNLSGKQLMIKPITTVSPYFNLPTMGYRTFINTDSLIFLRPDISFKFVTPPVADIYTWQHNINSYDFSNYGKLTNWNNGYIFGYSGYTSTPISGSVRNAGFGISHNFTDKLNFTASISALKYNMPGFTYNSNFFSGQLSYSFNKNFSISVFGEYESDNFFNNNRYHYSNPYNHSIGGFLTTTTNDNIFGVDIGVRKRYNPLTRRWDTVPIVRPHFKLAGNKLGVDFGELLLGLFDSVGLFDTDDWNTHHDNKSSGKRNRDNILLPRKH